MTKKNNTNGQDKHIIKNATRNEDIKGYIQNYNSTVANVENRSRRTIKAMVFYCLLAFAMILITGFLVTSSIITGKWYISTAAIVTVPLFVKFLAIAFSTPPQILPRDIPEQTIKEMESELKEKHIEYDNVALTNNRIIVLTETLSDEKVYSSIKYKDIAWLYTDTITNATSFSDKPSALTQFNDGNMEWAAIIVRSKDGQKITIKDHNGRIIGLLWSLHTDAKMSDDLDEVYQHIVNRLPKEALIGKTDENEDKYLSSVYKEIDDDNEEEK